MKKKKMSLTLQAFDLEPLDVNIVLTGSKSESNRALILKELSEGQIQIENLSQAEDTIIMAEALEKSRNAQRPQQEPIAINIGHAGTVMRFMTAYLSRKHGQFILDGSQRMRKRPIGPLVHALRCLGGDIVY